MAVSTTPTTADLREALVELLAEAESLVRSETSIVARQRFDVLTERMAAFIVSVSAPAALDVAAAVKRDPGRFQRTWAAARAYGTDSGDGDGFDRRVIVDRRSMKA